MATKERNRTLDYRPPPFPDDFGEQLERLKELSGLSWGEFAELLGVTQRGLLKWRRGGRPSGAYFWAIMELAREVPGGFELMLYGGAGWDGGTVGGGGVGARSQGYAPARPFVPPHRLTTPWGLASTSCG